MIDILFVHSNASSKIYQGLAENHAAWVKYHTSPKYVSQLEKKFGLAAKNELENTTKVSLKRKLLGD